MNSQPVSPSARVSAFADSTSVLSSAKADTLAEGETGCEFIRRPDLMSKRPHLILFNPDQWRGDCLGHLGHPAAQTPVLDRCVREDFVSFSRAFCQNPVCTPSRCSFMTGWYPHVRGHRTMHHMLRPDEPMLLRTLKQNGFFVWWGGKNDVVPAQNGFSEFCDVRFAPRNIRHRDLHGFDEWRGAPDSDTFYSFFGGKLDKGDDEIYLDSDWANVLGAVEAIHHHAQTAPPDQPLCLFLALSYPHPPYAVEEPYFSAIERDKLPPRPPSPNPDDKPAILRAIWEKQGLSGWSENRWDELRATYLGMCARVDDQFGLVLRALRESGLYDDAAVCCFADHGDYTGDYGLVEKTQNTFEDCLTRVPFLIKPPANVPVQARVSEALVELVDLPATVFELAGIEPGYSHFGRSLVPLLANETPHRDAVFCEGGRLPGEDQAKEPLPPQENLYWPRVQAQQSDGPEHGKAVMCRTDKWKFVRRLFERDELYDLEADPHEQTNLSGRPELNSTEEALRARLLRWFLETSDVVPFGLDRR